MLLPVFLVITIGNEPGIQQGFLLVVFQRLAGCGVDQLAAGGEQHRVSRSRVPFRGWAETRVDVGCTFRDQADFQRAAHADNLVITQ